MQHVRSGKTFSGQVPIKLRSVDPEVAAQTGNGWVGGTERAQVLPENTTELCGIRCGSSSFVRFSLFQAGPLVA